MNGGDNSEAKESEDNTRKSFQSYASSYNMQKESHETREHHFTNATGGSDYKSKQNRKVRPRRIKKV